MRSLRLPDLLIFGATVACANVTLDEEGNPIGDGDGDGDLTGGTTGSGGGNVVTSGGNTGSGGVLLGNGGSLLGSGGAASGGSSSGGSTSGGASSGGAGSGGAGSGGAGSGGSGSGGSSPGSCPNVAFNSPGVPLNTTGEACLTAVQAAEYGWGAYDCQGRTITINGEVRTPGDIDWPGSAPYTIEFSAGMYAHCSFAYW